MGFDFFYEGEEDDFIFIRIPKALFTNPAYRELTNDARMLYGLILDRVSLSKKNGWKDEHGRIYIYFTLKEIENQLFISHAKAVQLLGMLEKWQLILKMRQGQGRPCRIYPLKLSLKEVRNSNIQKSENHTSESSDLILPEVWNPNTNNTKENKTDWNKIESYLSLNGPIGSELSQKAISEYIDEQCAFAALIHDMPESRDEILEIRELILEVLSRRAPEIRICSEMRSTEAVRSRFMKLNAEHIRYVLSSLSENTGDIKNIKQYLLAALYNAPLTMGHYYRTKVNHDLYDGFLSKGDYNDMSHESYRL